MRTKFQSASQFLPAGSIRRPLPPHPNPLPEGEGETSSAAGDFERLGLGAARRWLLPLPRGEGWGEGEERVEIGLCSRLNSQLSTPQSGIVLVITLILLSVITFMAITLLVVTRAQKGTVTTVHDQTTAGLAADTGPERPKMAILAPMIAQTNPFNFDFFVSTNYINPLGFTPNNSSPTNVNYDHTYLSSSPLTAAQALQNLGNLLYDPRAPVWVTNRLGLSNEFRHYRDENRNGVFDPTGLQPVYDVNGVPLGTSNYFVGDPQWVGVLERPGLPHS